MPFSHLPILPCISCDFFIFILFIRTLTLYFFGLSFTWGRTGKFLRPSSTEDVQSSAPCASHTHPIPSACHHSTQRAGGARGQQQEPAVSGMGHGANAIFYSRGSSVSSRQTQTTLAPSLVTGERRVWQGTPRGAGVTHKGRFAFQNYPSSGAAPYLPFPSSAPGDTIPFLHQLGVFGSKGNLVPPQ